MHEITLRRGKEEPLKRKHPWVFSGAIDKQPSNIQDGDVVQVTGSSKEILGIGLYSPTSIAVKVVGFGKDACRKGINTLLVEHVEAALSLRRSLGLLHNPETTAFRLVNAEGDNLPGLIIDIYGDTAVMQAHSEGMHRLQEVLANILTTLDSLSIKTIVYSREGLGKEGEKKSSPEAIVGDLPGSIEITENGIKFEVDVVHGQKTGFFLDQRLNRKTVGALCQNRTVLNVCSYTGGFSVYALKHGAKEVTSLDLSKEALTLAEKNASLNVSAPSHKTISQDCFEYLTNTDSMYDCIILDPPAFAKHRGATKNALNGYRTLNRLGIGKLNPGGILATFSCSQLVSRDEFEQAVMSAAIESGRVIKILHRLSQSPCHPTSIFHPEGPYLKGLILEVC